MPNPASRYEYSESLGRYRDTRTGRFVPQARITSLLNRQTTITQREMNAVSQQLMEGKIDLNDWRMEMREHLRTIHSAQAAAANGGFDRMTQADWGRVGGKLRYQYERLDLMASQIQYGAQPLDGRMMQRVRMYAQSGHATYEETRRDAERERGMSLERRVLGAAEHCDDCVEYSAEGWQPLGTLPRIGDSVCMTNCKCHFEFSEN